MENENENTNNADNQECPGDLIRDRGTYGDRRCRFPRHQDRVVHVRNVIRRRIESEVPEAEGTNFLSWIWPWQKSRAMGDYNIDPRWYVRKRADAPGLPRWSINHFLQSDCRRNAITTTTPDVRLIKSRNGKVMSGSFVPGMVKPDPEKRKGVYELVNLEPGDRQRVCQSIKNGFIDVDIRGRQTATGWSPRYPPDVLRQMFQQYKQHVSFQQTVPRLNMPRESFEFNVQPNQSRPPREWMEDVVLQFSRLNSDDPKIQAVQKTLHRTALRMTNPTWESWIRLLDSYGLDTLKKRYKKYRYEVGGLAAVFKDDRFDHDVSGSSLSAAEKAQLREMVKFLSARTEMTPEGASRLQDLQTRLQQNVPGVSELLQSMAQYRATVAAPVQPPVQTARSPVQAVQPPVQTTRSPVQARPPSIPVQFSSTPLDVPSSFNIDDLNLGSFAESDIVQNRVDGGSQTSALVAPGGKRTARNSGQKRIARKETRNQTQNQRPTSRSAQSRSAETRNQTRNQTQIQTQNQRQTAKSTPALSVSSLKTRNFDRF